MIFYLLQLTFQILLQVSKAAALIVFCLIIHATLVFSIDFDNLYEDYDTTESTTSSEASTQTEPSLRSSTTVASSERKVTFLTGREARRRGQVGRTAGVRRFTTTNTGKFQNILSTMKIFHTEYVL